MAGHIQDLWHAGRGKERTRSSRYGLGKRWRARWIDPSGKERTKVFATQDEAKAFLAQVEVQIMRGGYIDPNAGKRTLADFVDHDWLPGYSANPSTLEAVGITWRKHIKPALGDLPLHSIKALQLRHWLRGLEANGLSLTTQHLIRAHLWAMLEGAVDAELLAGNPLRTKSTKLPPRVRHRVQPWTSAQVSAVWHALPERYAVLVVLGASLGLRQGELFGLALEDVDFMHRTVRVSRQVKLLSARQVFAPPKFRKVREIPLPDETALLLSDYIRRFPPKPVTLPWGTPTGEPVTARLLVTGREHKALNRNYVNQHIWRPAVAKAGISDEGRTGMHALRHHFASLYLSEGGDIRSLAEYLGHSDPGFTLRTYTHLMPESADRMRKLIGRRVADAFDLDARAVESGT